MITTTHTIENTTETFLLVGNCSDVIAAYDTLEEAKIGLEEKVPCIESSKWGSVRILAPGETATARYCQAVPPTAAQAAKAEAEGAAFFAQFLPAL